MRSTTCPNCGLAKYRNVAPESAHFVYDRICKDCDTRYTPPTPNWMAAIGISAGLLILAITGAMLVGAVALNEGPPVIDMGDGAKLIAGIVFLVTAGGTAVIAGVRHFRSGNQTTDLASTGKVDDLEGPQCDEP